MSKSRDSRSSAPSLNTTVMFALRSSRAAHNSKSGVRYASTHHRILIVGAGTGGTTVASQLRKAFKAEGRPLKDGELALVDKAEKHHCEYLKALGVGPTERTAC